MLNGISRFFGKKDKTKRVESARSVLSDNGIGSHGSNAADAFLTSLKSLGHPDYPILDRNYSPNSRVPCTDLVPFICERMVEGDIKSIKTVMRAVVEANPGLGIGPDWIDESVENVLSMPFENYISFSSPDGLNELRALFIIAAKAGGGREFLITEEIPRLTSWALIARNPSWSNNLQSLAEKANFWIATMAEDTPYWQKYERFDVNELPKEQIETGLQESISSLTPAARLQLLFAIQRGGGSLLGLTNYQIRNLGINIESTSKELLESGLILPSHSLEAIESAHSKQELIDLCESYGTTYRKSWSKQKLVQALQEMDSSVLEEIAESKQLVSPSFRDHPELGNVVRIADEHQVGFKLVCFA